MPFLSIPFKGIDLIYVVKKGWLVFLKGGVDMLSKDCLFLVVIVIGIGTGTIILVQVLLLLLLLLIIFEAKSSD